MEHEMSNYYVKVWVSTDITNMTPRQENQMDKTRQNETKTGTV